MKSQRYPLPVFGPRGQAALVQDERGGGLWLEDGGRADAHAELEALAGSILGDVRRVEWGAPDPVTGISRARVYAPGSFLA